MARPGQGEQARELLRSGLRLVYGRLRHGDLKEAKALVGGVAGVSCRFRMPFNCEYFLINCRIEGRMICDGLGSRAKRLGVDRCYFAWLCRSAGPEKDVPAVTSEWDDPREDDPTRRSQLYVMMPYFRAWCPHGAILRSRLARLFRNGFQTSTQPEVTFGDQLIRVYVMRRKDEGY